MKGQKDMTQALKENNFSCWLATCKGSNDRTHKGQLICETAGQMALFTSTHAETSLLCKLQLLNWKPGPERSTHCPPTPLLFSVPALPPSSLRSQLISSPWNHLSEDLCMHTFPARQGKKHSYIDLHRKHILFHFKTLPGQCGSNSKPTAGNLPSSIGLLSAFGSDIHLGGLRGACKLWCPGFEIYKFWLPLPHWSRASTL